MKTSTSIILTTAFIATLNLIGLTRTAHAKQLHPQAVFIFQHSSSTPVTEANDTIVAFENTKQSQARAMAPSNTLIKVAEARDEGNGETKYDANEQQESALLQSLAKITPQQAAETARRGQESRVKLENENGNLVYAVEIGQQEVKVDAGNSKVLYTENASQEDEKSEAACPCSSIQVPGSSDRPSSKVPSPIPQNQAPSSSIPTSVLESSSTQSTTSRPKLPSTSPLIDPNPPAEVQSPSLQTYGI